MYQVPPPILIVLDDTQGGGEVAMNMCMFPRQVLVSTKQIVPLNSTSVSVEYNKKIIYISGNMEGNTIFLNTGIQR